MCAECEQSHRFVVYSPVLRIFSRLASIITNKIPGQKYQIKDRVVLWMTGTSWMIHPLLCSFPTVTTAPSIAEHCTGYCTCCSLFGSLLGAAYAHGQYSCAIVKWSSVFKYLVRYLLLHIVDILFNNALSLSLYSHPTTQLQCDHQEALTSLHKKYIIII